MLDVQYVIGLLVGAFGLGYSVGFHLLAFKRLSDVVS